MAHQLSLRRGINVQRLTLSVPVFEGQALLVDQHGFGTKGLREADGAEDDFAVCRPTQADTPPVVRSVEVDLLILNPFAIDRGDRRRMERRLETGPPPVDSDLRV